MIKRNNLISNRIINGTIWIWIILALLTAPYFTYYAGSLGFDRYELMLLVAGNLFFMYSVARILYILLAKKMIMQVAHRSFSADVTSGTTMRHAPALLVVLALAAYFYMVLVVQAEAIVILILLSIPVFTMSQMLVEKRLYVLGSGLYYLGAMLSAVNKYEVVENGELLLHLDNRQLVVVADERGELLHMLQSSSVAMSK